MSPIELANAMRLIAQESAGIEQEPVFCETVARFGAKRLTEEVRRQLTAARELGERTGRLQWHQSGAVLPT